MINKTQPHASYKLIAGYWVMAWLLASTFFIALLLSFFPDAFWLFILKDGALGAFILIFLAQLVKKLSGFPKWIFLVPLFFLAATFFSPAPLLAKFASLRQLLMPFIVFVFGMVIVENTAQFAQLKQWILKAAIVLSVIGFLFYLFPFWEYFSLKAFATAKNLLVRPDGALQMFYDPSNPFFPRLVSTVLDPINAGHLLAFAFITGLSEKTKSWSSLVIIFAALLLTFCKGAFLQLAIVGLLSFRNKIPVWLFIISWLLIIGGLFVASFFHEGVLLHLQGLMASLKTISLLGHGIGMAGNQAVMYGNPAETAISDTFIGTIIGQAGVIGLVLWLLPFFWMIQKLASEKLLQALLISQLLVAILSENAFNFLSILWLITAIGAWINYTSKHETHRPD